MPALVLSHLTVLGPAAAEPALSFEKYRVQLAGAPARPASTRQFRNVSPGRDLAAGLPGIKLAPAPAAPIEGSRTAILPWTGVGHNARGMFSGSRALLHVSAVAGTFLIIKSGLDTDIHNYFARHNTVEEYSHPGVAFGSLVPVILGGGLLGRGLTGGSSELASAGSAVLQASLFAVSYSTLLKALTGRPHPGERHEQVIYNDNNASETFRFGFLRGGVFWGWPSGHMLANTAAVTSLLAFYGDRTWLKIAGGTYLSYLFLSVISHGRSSMHWFSDAVAGTLMGFAVGTTVGKDFRRRWEGARGDTARLSFGASPQLLSVCFSFEL